ncbi:MAG TPA: VWA domain-containing protein [Terracidiphilus sp.]|nr:VWA domain-containing protein [Terracidiphilus sp.]
MRERAVSEDNGAVTFVRNGMTPLTAIGASLLFGITVWAEQQQQPVPDAPAPNPQPLSNVSGPITPGIGSGQPSAAKGNSTSSDLPPAAGEEPNVPQTQAPPAQNNEPTQKTPPEIPPSGEGVERLGALIHLNVNFVEVPVTVKDSKGRLVSGLTWREFKVYENGKYEPLRLFSVDSAPLSIAFVIDQSVTKDVMAKVNDSLNSIQGALTPYDEVSVFSYSNGAQERTTFTGAQSARLPMVLAMTKAAGTEMLVPDNDSPFASCNIRVNGNCADPNIQAGRSAGDSTFITIPKEIHTLNDAILAAAKELSSRPKERRRIIYVVSDGKEYGSKAKYGDVLRYLQTNNIAVYGTLVGDSARWGEGYISKFHLPFTMYNNLLAKYSFATGGTLDSENGVNGMETSYAKIAEEARTQYTLGYLSHQPIIDDKYRKIDVRVDRPGLDVIAKLGYYPTAETLK